MQEVTIRLRFARPCLGAVQQKSGNGKTTFCMLRDPADRIMFLSSWWRDRLRYAAKVANTNQALVQRIDWDPVVDGSLDRNYRRVVVPAREAKGRMRYAVHEVFPAGSVIGVNAVLPDGLTVDAFTSLLTLVGTYKGISPFVDEDEPYGTFEVISVKPTVRGVAEQDVKEESPRVAKHVGS